MKLTWTSPDQIPGVQRWGVLPLFFCAAGALGGGVGDLLCRAIAGLGERRYGPEIWALIDGSIGLAVGMSVVLVRWGWMRIVVSPVLAVSWLFTAAILYRSGHGELDLIPFRQLLEDRGLRGTWLLGSALLVASHLAWLRFAPLRESRALGVMMYGCRGALSGMAEVWIGTGLDRSWPVWGLAGTMVGMAHRGAMSAEQAFSGARPRGGGEAA